MLGSQLRISHARAISNREMALGSEKLERIKQPWWTVVGFATVILVSQH